MHRLSVGIALLCLAAVGCSKQSTAATVSPSASAAPMQAAATPSDNDATPIAIAQPQEAEDPNRPWLSTATGSEYLLIGQNEQSFGVWVDVPKSVGGHVPTALTLAIDTSGSMRGDKIIHAREAARRLINELEPGDMVSLVTFASNASTPFPPTVVDEHTRRQLLNRVEELTAEGGTALQGGLAQAQAGFRQIPATHLVRRIVVISDGKATVGSTDPGQLGRLAGAGLQNAVQVTALGVGVDYDELTLNELAVRSSGRLYHVEQSEQLPAIVEEEIALLESTAAAGVEVELVAAPGVRILGTDVAQTRWSGESLMIPLGTLFSGQQRELLVRARVDDQGQEGPKVLASVRLHFRDPAEGGLKRVQETILRAQITDDPALVRNHEHSRTQTLIAMREASTWTHNASRFLNSGDLEEADRQLAQAEARLEQQHRRAKTKADKARVKKSASKIAQQRSSVSKAKKAKPAKRAASARRIALEANDMAMDAAGY